MANQVRDIEHFRMRLLEMKTQLENDIQTQLLTEQSLSGGPDEPGPGQHWENAGAGDHAGDEATELFEREKSQGLELALREHLRQAEHALSRVEDGSYGQCEKCGKAIAPARLEAMPEATLCIDCKAAEEENPGPGMRRDLAGAGMPGNSTA